MSLDLSDSRLIPRVAIGGIGGSGTRVLAKIIRMAGLQLGGDLNDALDNLWFTLLFKERGVSALDDAAFDRRLRLFIAANAGGMPLDDRQRQELRQLSTIPRPDEHRPQHDRAWLAARAESAVLAAAAPAHDRPWGWKEPNTHICIDRIAARLPTLKYIHLARNGLDMAYSANCAQLAFWGQALLGRPVLRRPRDALAYWCAVHRRIFSIARELKGRFLFLRFEDLCAEPVTEIRRVMEFLEIPVSSQCLREMAAAVRTPPSIGRWRERSLDVFDAQDVAYVGTLGFDIDDGVRGGDEYVGTGVRDHGASLEALLDGVEGWMPMEDARYLSERACSCGGDVVEIGSYRGRSTIALAHGLARSGLPGTQVYAIEPHAPARGIYGAAFGPEDRRHFFANVLAAGLAERIALINLPSHRAARAWEGEIALLFIDGDHRYAQVKRDAALWTPFLRPGGLVIFDDARMAQDGPSRVIGELLDSGAFERGEGTGKLQALVKRKTQTGR